MSQLTEEQRAEQLKQIRRARELGILPWSHLSSPTQIFEVARNTIDCLLSLLDSHTTEAESFLCRYCFSTESTAAPSSSTPARAEHDTAVRANAIKECVGQVHAIFEGMVAVSKTELVDALTSLLDSEPAPANPGSISVSGLS